MNIFCDLDGTLIDSKPRLFALFRNLVPEAAEFSFEQYWRWKLDGLKHDDILKNEFQYDENQMQHFIKSWFEKIETEKYLAFDKPFSFSIEGLSLLQGKGHQLYLVTTRRDRATAIRQLQQLELEKYFKQILITEKLGDKVAMVRELSVTLSPSDIFVGDTEEDIRSGKELGIRTASVLSGFRSEKELQKWAPDYLYHDFEEFVLSII